MNESIKLVQVPVIVHALNVAGAKVTERLSLLGLDKLIASEDTVKALKGLRAELNNELADYEAQRKAIKDGVMNPYNDFESIYKDEIAVKYKNAVDLLKTKIDAVETEVKTRKKESLLAYFKELVASENIDFLMWHHLNIDINLSTSEKKYKEQINAFVSRVKDDLAMINASEFPVESMAEYKTTLNASRAITTVKERKDREKEERLRVRKARFAARERDLLRIGMERDDMLHSFNFIANGKAIDIPFSIMEEAMQDDWLLTYNEAAELISNTKRATRVAPPVEVATSVLNAPADVVTDTTTSGTIPHFTPDPMKELFTATFEVCGTMAELKALSGFLKSNNITYKNL